MAAAGDFDEDMLGGDIGIDDDDFVEDEAHADDEDDLSDVENNVPAKPKAKRQKKEIKPLIGGRKRQPSASAAHPERQRYERSQRFAKRLIAALNMRPDIKIEILNHAYAER